MKNPLARGNHKKKYSLGKAFDLVASLVFGAHKRRRPYKEKQVQELLNQRFPEESVSFRKRTKGTWICWFEDMPEVIFGVRVATGGGDPVPMLHSYLSCNDREVFWRHYIEKYCQGGGTLDAWQVTKMRSGETYLAFSYTTVREVRRAIGQLRMLCQWGQTQLHWDRAEIQRECCIFCTFRGGPLPDVSPLRHTSRVQPRVDLDKLLQECIDVIEEYHAFYLLPSADFTQEELLAYAVEKWNWEDMQGSPAYVWKGEEKLPLKMFSGIPIYGRSDCWPEVSCGWLYMMALRLGIDVEGTPEHFQFTGADGETYEFSYLFFHDVEVTQYGQKKAVRRVWYYLRGGVRVEQEMWKYANKGRVMPQIEISHSVSDAMLGIRLEYTK